MRHTGGVGTQNVFIMGRIEAKIKETRPFRLNLEPYLLIGIPVNV